MPDEIKGVEIISSDGKIIKARFLLWEEDLEDSNLVRLSLDFLGKEIVKSGNDFFSTMCLIRRELEKEELLLRCYGASKNVFPSPMSRSMGSGVKAYKLRMGYPARKEDLVTIFDSGTDLIPTSVDDQESYYKEWLKSLVS